MAESLKAARERVATEICTASPAPCPACLKDLRALQRQAMEAILAHIGGIEFVPGTGWIVQGEDSGVTTDGTLTLDALLDGPAQALPEPPPHHPPRCIRCGLHEGIGHPGNHAFQPQSPRCHRAHPHSEPCEPERQAAAETRGWSTVEEKP